jgi:DNA polymerase III alpha subunit (gram-positive type)
MRTFVSLDIETTGLDPDRDAILEIGVVKFRGEETLDEWSAIIDPRNAASAKVLKRLSFVKEEHLRERWSFSGEVSDTEVNGFLRSEWMSASQSLGSALKLRS